MKTIMDAVNELNGDLGNVDTPQEIEEFLYYVNGDCDDIVALVPEVKNE